MLEMSLKEYDTGTLHTFLTEGVGCDIEDYIEDDGSSVIDVASILADMDFPCMLEHREYVHYKFKENKYSIEFRNNNLYNLITLTNEIFNRVADSLGFLDLEKLDISGYSKSYIDNVKYITPLLITANLLNNKQLRHSNYIIELIVRSMGVVIYTSTLSLYECEEIIDRYITSIDQYKKDVNTICEYLNKTNYSNTLRTLLNDMEEDLSYLKDSDYIYSFHGNIGLVTDVD